MCLQFLKYPDHDFIQRQTSADTDLLIVERTAELYELNRFLTAIVDSSTETFIIAVGSNGLILSFNEGACHLFNRSKTEVVGRSHIQDFFLAGHGTNTWLSMVEKAQAHGSCRQLVELVQKGGRVFPALTDLTPLRNDENQVLGMLFVGRDVTESQLIQLALEQRKQELEFINTLSLQISQTLDPEDIGSISLRNTLRILQGIAGGIYLKIETEEEPSLAAIHVMPENAFLAKYINLTARDHLLLEDGDIIIRELVLTEPPPDATEIPAYYFLSLPLTSKAKYIGAMILIGAEEFTHTEELKRFSSAIGATVGAAIENAVLYADTVKKSAEIKRQNRELDEFAYIVSHDLKEPLAGIAFISDLIVKEYYDQFDSTGQVYISSLIDFSKRLDTLIDTLLDLSRIGRIIQPSEEVNIDLVVREVLQNLSYRIETQRIKVIRPDVFPSVYGDRTRITQVFFNLMSNAMKFNDKPNPVVEVLFVANPEEPEFVTFCIRDNGIGIEEVYFDKIFKIFERLHSREEYEGTGAGLTIVKKIVEHHGGRIWLESTLDVGTAFYFTLPRYQNGV